MAKIFENNRNVDRTVEIFDAFYGLGLTVDAAQYDVVFSFFYQTSKNRQTAGNFTVILFRIAQETGINVITLLNELRGVTNEKLKLTKTIAYYLNSLKSKTALYGISRLPLPNAPVARNVIL